MPHQHLPAFLAPLPLLLLLLLLLVATLLLSPLVTFLNLLLSWSLQTNSETNDGRSFDNSTLPNGRMRLN